MLNIDKTTSAVGGNQGQNPIVNIVETDQGSKVDESMEAQKVMEKNEDVTKLNITADEVVLNQQSESLKSLLAYTDSSDDSDCTETNQDNCDKTSSSKPESGSSDSESDSSDEESVTFDSESENEEPSIISSSSDEEAYTAIEFPEPTNKGAVKKTPVATYDDCGPPIPDLSTLSLSSDVELMQIGRVANIINRIVTVQSIQGTPAFDLDSILFFNDGTSKKPLGPIDDVIGPVAEPIYCVRFNHPSDISNAGIKIDMEVYAAPKCDEYSKFVFVRELLEVRGTDASWLNDEERPQDMLDFSDDEQERAAKRTELGKRKLKDNSLERHKMYEHTMNQCNTVNTRMCKLIDSKHKPPTMKANRFRMKKQLTASTSQSTTTMPPEFNPSVPPPGFATQPTTPMCFMPYYTHMYSQIGGYGFPYHYPYQTGTPAAATAAPPVPATIWYSEYPPGTTPTQPPTTQGNNFTSNG